MKPAEKKSSGHGGARPGSGRKKKVQLLAGPIERIRGDIEELAPLLGPSLRELVNGVYVEETDSHGTRRIYRQPPNLGAIQTVIDRVLGKVGDRREITGAGGGPIIIEVKDDAPPREPEVER